MGSAFAAVAAGITALLEATTASRYQFAGAQLQLLLVLAIAVTLVYGFDAGMAWAFVGGLISDFLTLRPLGTTIFGLLIVVALSELVEPLIARSRYPGCLILTFVLTPLYLAVSDGVTALLRPPAPSLQLTGLIIGGLLNVALMAVAAPLVIGLRRRSEQRERVVWWR